MHPVIDMLRERRNAIKQVVLPSYKEHSRRERERQQETWVPPEQLYEPSPQRPEENSELQVPAVVELGVFKALQRKTTAKPVQLLDDGDKDDVFDVGDIEAEQDCVLEAYPLSVVEAQQMGVAEGPKTRIGTFGELRAMVTQARSAPHPLAKQALAETTREEHLRVLSIIQFAPKEFDKMSVATGLLELLARTRQKRRWKWSTLAKKLASVQGALRILPLYVQTNPVVLADIPEWKHGVKYATTRAREEAPRAVRPMTADQALRAVDNGKDLEIKSTIALSWLIAARVGDVLQLKGEDVAWNETDSTLTITYRRGKTISKRGPFSVHCEVPAVWSELARWIANRTRTREREKLFKCTVATVTKALRDVDRALESRSLRRGALQTMALAGVDENDLLAFSGHTTLAMLHRYLAWGAVGTKRKARMGTASRQLWTIGGGEPEDTSEHVAEEERMPRFLKHLGQEAPETAEFWRFFGKKDERKQAWKLPLHLKDVIGALNWRQVLELPMQPALKQYVQETTRWLYDKTKYLEILNREGRTKAQGNVKWTKNDVYRYAKAKKVEFGKTPQEGIGGARAFSTPEWEKNRRRSLWESFVNDKIWAVPTVRFRSRDERHTIIAQSQYAALFDFSAYYDQITLEENVREFHGTTWRGKWLQPTVLPMGFRPACAIAQALTWAIVDGLTKGTKCTIITYIDNVGIFGGTEADVKLVAQRFVDRCREVGAVLNNSTIAVTTKFEFLGVNYDLSTAKRNCTDKTHDKIEAVRDYLRPRLKVKDPMVNLTLSKREVAAVVGVALYASQICDYTLCNVYWVMRYWREVAATTHWDQWEEAAPPMRRNTLCTLVSWITALAKNKPVPITSRDVGPEDAILFVDASARGYGVVAVTATSVQCASGNWTEEIAQSTTAEPLGAWLALCRFVKPTWRSVVVVSDHKPLVQSGEAQCAKSYEYNQLFRRISTTYPSLNVRFMFIPGTENPGDEPSRARAVDGAKVEAAVEKIRNEIKRKYENGKLGEEWVATAHNPLRIRVSG